jgi:serine/threonine-protein kinase RsbW
MTPGPDAGTDEARDFAARYASIAATAAFANDYCARHGIDRTRALKLTLILEELLTNTIEHGHGAESDATVRVLLRAAPEGLVMGYEDSAPPFDPTDPGAQAAAALDDPLDDRPVGGLGLRLIDGLASAVGYCREHGRNRLWLTLAARTDSSPG